VFLNKNIEFKKYMNKALSPNADSEELIVDPFIKYIFLAATPLSVDACENSP